MTSLRQRHGGREQLARVQPLEPCALAQIALAVGVEPLAELRDRLVQTDGGERILQAAASAQMHVHIAARDEPDAAFGADARESGEAPRVLPFTQQLHRDPHPAGEACGEPAQLTRLRPCRRQPQDEALLGAECLKILARECVSPLDGRAAAAGDEPAQLPVALPVDGERDELQAAAEAELRADDEFQLTAFRCHVRPHDARHRALVGEGERAVAERIGLLDELVRMRRTAQEGEVRDAMQLRVRGQLDHIHPKTPCRNHPCGAARSRNTHSRTPWPSTAV